MLRPGDRLSMATSNLAAVGIQRGLCLYWLVKHGLGLGEVSKRCNSLLTRGLSAVFGCSDWS